MLMKIDPDRVRELGGVGEAAFEVHKALLDFFRDAVVVQGESYKNLDPIPLAQYSSETISQTLRSVNDGILKLAVRSNVKAILRLTQKEVGEFPFLVHPQKYVIEKEFLESCGVLTRMKVDELRTFGDFFQELFAIADNNKCEGMGYHVRHVVLKDNEQRANLCSFHFFFSHALPTEVPTFGLTFAIFLEFDK